MMDSSGQPNIYSSSSSSSTAFLLFDFAFLLEGGLAALDAGF
jgi:hypothetical protein